MQRELYEVEKDRFDLKDSSLNHLQGTWPIDHKPEAVLDGDTLPADISAQGFRIWKANRSLVSMR